MKKKCLNAKKEEIYTAQVHKIKSFEKDMTTKARRKPVNSNMKMGQTT